MSKPQRMDAYLRVSRVGGRAGESFISPTVQREQIEGWARLRGVEIAAEHEDLDQSGGKLRRPGLDALLARIESGETGGVVVAKLDRLSRLGVPDALKLVEQITTAGGSIAALDLGLDPTTPFGEFGTTIMLALAHMERRRLADSWAVAQSRAIERGAKVSRTPYGYRRLDDGTIEPDPVESVHVRQAFELAAAQGMSAASVYLNENAPGRFWTTHTTRRMLARRSYLGESRHGAMFNAEGHEPLVSRAIWEAAQHEPRAQVRSGTYPLSGAIHCGTCGATMVAGPRASNRERIYRCSAAQTLYKGERCMRPAAILADGLEVHLREELRVLFAGLALDHAEGGDGLVVAERAMYEARLELDAFASDLTMRRALGDGYHDKLAIRVEAVEATEAAYRELARDAQERTLLTGEEAIEDPALMGMLLRSMRLTIHVKSGRGKVGDRVVIAPYERDASSRE
jgi:DNA invertase Pin-like site-specific DNA recombinase